MRKIHTTSLTLIWTISMRFLWNLSSCLFFFVKVQFRCKISDWGSNKFCCQRKIVCNQSGQQFSKKIYCFRLNEPTLFEFWLWNYTRVWLQPNRICTILKPVELTNKVTTYSFSLHAVLRRFVSSLKKDTMKSYRICNSTKLISVCVGSDIFKWTLEWDFHINN